jgi:hypothetical protein
MINHKLNSNFKNYIIFGEIQDEFVALITLLSHLVNSDGFQSKVSWQMENSCGKLHETITIGNYG